MTAALRTRRQSVILDVVREEPIASQEELLAALERRGLKATQATLSRDLKELQVARVPAAAGYRYLPAGEAPTPGVAPAAAQLVTAEVLSVEQNEVAIVVRTAVARAQGVAVFLDGLKDKDLLATLAGDDTVLCIPRSIKRTNALRKRLLALFDLDR